MSEKRKVVHNDYALALLAYSLLPIIKAVPRWILCRYTACHIWQHPRNGVVKSHPLVADSETCKRQPRRRFSRVPAALALRRAPWRTSRNFRCPIHSSSVSTHQYSTCRCFINKKKKTPPVWHIARCARYSEFRLSVTMPILPE
jgi:hypothetical protein